MGNKDSQGSAKVYIALHILLALFSTSGVFQKLASRNSFMSFGFIAFFCLMVGVLGIYAIGWQQVIKRLPLTTAYANRAVTVAWGIVWGALLFREHISLLKILGAAVVLAGVAYYAHVSHDDVQSLQDSRDGEVHP